MPRTYGHVETCFLINFSLTAVEGLIKERRVLIQWLTSLERDRS